MPSDAPKTVISQKRFLVVDSESAVAEAMRRFLLAEGAPAVHVAPSPLLGLRILQDRRSPVDCIICAQRLVSPGVEFLSHLRSGRWGSALQNVNFILLLPSRDEAMIQAADSVNVNGYIVGLDKENVRRSILKALDATGTATAPPNFKIAHLRASEADLVIALFPPPFGLLSFEKQEQARMAVAAAVQAAQINGAVAAVYPGDKGETAFVAPQLYHRFLSKLSIGFINKLPQRMIHFAWTDGDPTKQPENAADIEDEPLTVLPLFEEDITDRRRSQPRSEKFARGLTEDDIRAVAAGFKDIGPAQFVETFVRYQAISLQGDAKPLTPLMHEYFVSIELLRSKFFPEVEMRGSKRAFQSLTHLLDQLMLRSLPYLPQNGLPCSLNLNVHSILSKTFESTLKNARLDTLTFEIPHAMISSYFEEFKAARDLIVSRGGKIAVDQIFPDAIDGLNLDEIRPDFAKLHWKGDLKNFSAAHRDFVKRTTDSGITMVMSRVDDPAAFDIGQKFGIQNFQGFLIDEMAGSKSGAAG